MALVVMVVIVIVISTAGHFIAVYIHGTATTLAVVIMAVVVHIRVHCQSAILPIGTGLVT
jgi:hypothetical protein